MPRNNRVVVTGVGVLCPVGLDTAATWDALICGKSGIGEITLFDPAPFATRFAGEVPGFTPTDYLSRRQAQHTDRFTQLALAASQEAVRQAAIKIGSANQNDIGVIIGSGLGGLDTLTREARVLHERGPKRVNPFLVPMMAADMAAAQVSIMLGARGPSLSPTSSCASGADAIGIAAETIRRGDAQVVLAGGSEAAVTPISLAAFNALRALSTRNSEPQLASRPFDNEHDGFVLSEGAAVLVLENLTSARSRHVKILAEVAGYGTSSDAHHVTHPAESGTGMARAMSMALAKAGLKPDEIDYINAHGTATPLNDRMETKAIKAVFGEAAYKVPVSSTKSMTGHLIGAAGALEAAICVMVIQQGIIPPTINLTEPDPECDLDYTPNKARRAMVNTVLSNSFGFGGHNSALVFTRYAEEF
ncbi:MAG: beta-ketoacyl-ACP synthase II [Dehalococcoidales bacterium]|nr:beta-ketoacyl-ACP synthase II [Dehalococcoidales bacterium]